MSSHRVSLALGLLMGLAASAHARSPAPSDAASSAPARARQLVARWLRGEVLDGTSVGISVVGLDDGLVWVDHEATRLKYPASVAKLLTTVAALKILPADTRWTTTVHGVIDEAGVVAGDLVLVGAGDPQLMPKDVAELATALVTRGVREVRGGIVVDTSRFAGPLQPPGYDLKQTDAGYRANVSAAGSNYGAFVVALRPARVLDRAPRVTLSPASDALVLVNRARTVAGERAQDLTVVARPLADGRTQVVIDGELGIGAKRSAVRKRAADPGLATGYLLRAALARQGVSVAGTVRVVTTRPPGERGPCLASLQSASLAATLRDMNTWSNNAMAETVFKHLGAGPAGEPATWARAQRVVSSTLTGLGVPAEQVHVVNGSGLYLATQVSPRAITRVLAAMSGPGSEAEVFRASLPVAGQSGTLKWRLRRRATRGKVRAKTGTLDEVVALAGYVPTCEGHTLAVAVLINDAQAARTRALRRAVDRLIVGLARL